jgi:hypothetical protein
MVPRITSKGHSFKGAGAYFLHDLGKAKTAERVAFTRTLNMLTNDPEAALKIMAWTALHAGDLKEISGQKTTGRKAENPVYNFTLAWAPDQNPDQAHMVQFAERALNTLGLKEHEALLIAHNDTDHKHLHVMVNRVHPVTGLMAKMAHDQNKLSRLAQTYEEETGQIYCRQRVTNNRARDLGIPHVKDQTSQPVTEQAEYQERRAARIDAQKQAAALHGARLKAEAEKATAARDLHAAFDQAAGRDDLQYWAKDSTRSEVDERGEAAKAWADEQIKERERIKKTEGDQRAAKLQAAKEQARRVWLDKKRADEWATYEAGKWQTLNDKQTDRREGLRELQDAARATFDERMGRKYEPPAAVLDRRIDRLTADLEKRGLRGLVAKITGQHADRQRQLDTLEKARTDLDGQQKREREADRAQRLGRPPMANDFKNATAQATEAQRAAVRDAIDEKDGEREVRAESAPFRRRNLEKDRDYER